jgi:hypothetical protein
VTPLDISVKTVIFQTDGIPVDVILHLAFLSDPFLGSVIQLLYDDGLLLLDIRLGIPDQSPGGCRLLVDAVLVLKVVSFGVWYIILC